MRVIPAGRAEAEPAAACGLKRSRRRTDAREHHSTPHHGGDRLSRVDVVFEVASQPYPLDERAATLMAENLRVKAAHEPGAEGTAGARAVADAIELRLIEDTADPTTLDRAAPAQPAAWKRRQAAPRTGRRSEERSLPSRSGGSLSARGGHAPG